MAKKYQAEDKYLCFVVDDDPGISGFVALTLARLHLETRGFESAEDTLEAMDRRHPQLIFLDVSLRGSDAVDVMRGLAERKFSGIVQLMSGRYANLLQDLVQVGEWQGLRMRPPITKPFPTNLLREIIRGERLWGQTLSTAPIDLAEALVNGSLALWYQPKIDFRTKMLAGAEGFVRAWHPQHGAVAPAAFLSGASDAQLEEVSSFVISRALQDWDHLFENGFRLRLSVNVPARLLASLAIPHLVRRFRPKREEWPGLTLEVSADEILQNLQAVRAAATQLRLYDVVLAVDNVGPMHLEQLGREKLDFWELKIARQFTSNLASNEANRSFCAAAIDLAHSCGRTVVAKGIETSSDMQVLHEIGCDTGQGFQFSPPVEKDEFIADLRLRLKKPDFSARSQKAVRKGRAAGTQEWRDRA